MAEAQRGLWSDDANYRKLTEPFPSIDAANEALKAFSEELYELRKQASNG